MRAKDNDFPRSTLCEPQIQTDIMTKHIWVEIGAW